MGNNGGLAIGQLRIALAQINPTLGDLTGNSELICEYAAKASAAGAHGPKRCRPWPRRRTGPHR